jgi:hypothetical protein
MLILFPFCEMQQPSNWELGKRETCVIGDIHLECNSIMKGWDGRKEIAGHQMPHTMTALIKF